MTGNFTKVRTSDGRVLWLATADLPSGGSGGGLPLTYDDGTYTYSLATGASGHLQMQVVDNATGSDVSLWELWSNTTDYSGGYLAVSSSSLSNYLKLVAIEVNPDIAPLEFSHNGNITRLAVWNGDPNGNVNATYVGELCVDTATPGLWQSGLTAGLSDWHLLGGGSGGFPISVDDGTHTSTVDVSGGNRLTSTVVRDSDALRFAQVAASVDDAGSGISDVTLQTTSASANTSALVGMQAHATTSEFEFQALDSVNSLDLHITNSVNNSHALKMDTQFQFNGTPLLQLAHTGTTPKVGFFNTTPAAQPTVTGSRGGNAALASLLTALANLGLIVDSST